MKWLSDQAVDRLRVAAATPDLSGTGYVLLDKLGADVVEMLGRQGYHVTGHRLELLGQMATPGQK